MIDAVRLLAWRNDPETRTHSFDTQPILEDTHRQWLTAMLAAPGERLFVAEVDGDPVGVGRLTRSGDATLLHLTIAPEHRGRGYAAPVIEALVVEACRDGLQHIDAYVKPDNIRSMRAFATAGFHQIDKSETSIRMRRQCA